MRSNRPKRLIDFLVDELEPHLPRYFRKFPPDLLTLIAQYMGNFKALCCPITGEVFDNPVFILHPKIAPIVYNDESLALVAEELEPYHLQPEQKIAVPFIKTLVNYVEHELDNSFLSDRPVSSSQREHNPHEIKLIVEEVPDAAEEPDVIEVKSFLEDKTAENNLKNLLRDPLVSDTNNLAQEIKRLINFESSNFQKTLAKLLTRYDWPVIQSFRPSEFRLWQCMPFLRLFIIASTFYRIMNTPGFDIDKIDDKFPLKLYVMCFTPFIDAIYQPHIYHSARRFGATPCSLPFVMSMLINYIHYLTNSIAGNAGLDTKLITNFLSAPIGALAESYASAAAIQFFAEDDAEHRLIKPFKKRNLACLLALNSVANIGFHYWYLLANSNYEKPLFQSFVPLICGFYTLNSLPRILVSSQQTATEVKEIVQDSHYMLRNTEGFVLSSREPIICKLKPVLRICSALLMGLFAYVVSENPIYAVVAMIAMFNETSLPNVLNGANHRYRLMPPPAQRPREAAITEEKATPHPV